MKISQHLALSIALPVLMAQGCGGLQSSKITLTPAEMSSAPLIERPIALSNGALVIPSAGLVVALLRDSLATFCSGHGPTHLEAIEIETGATRWRAEIKGLPVGAQGDGVVVASERDGKLVFERLSIADGSRSVCQDTSAPMGDGSAYLSFTVVRFADPKAPPFVNLYHFGPPSCGGGAQAEPRPAPKDLLEVQMGEGAACSYSMRVQPMESRPMEGSPWAVRLASGWVVRGEDHDSGEIPGTCKMGDPAPPRECLFHHLLVGRRPNGSAAWERIWQKEPKAQTMPP